jgi:hypothetical protein
MVFLMQLEHKLPPYGREGLLLLLLSFLSLPGRSLGIPLSTAPQPPHLMDFGLRGT